MDGKRSLLAEALLSIEDGVDTSGGFLLHHLIKRFLLSERPVILVAFDNPFSHYDCILHKLVREVACKGSAEGVMDFLHHCQTLISGSDNSFVFLLNHHDIFWSMDRPTLMLYLEYVADVLPRAEPFATGAAVDVHGQLRVLNRGANDKSGNLEKDCKQGTID